MTLARQILSLLRESASPDVRPDKSSERVWHLKDPGLFVFDGGQRQDHVDTLKIGLLETLARTGTAMIHHPESPLAENLPGEWIAGPQPQAWHVPVDLNLRDESVDYWLFTLGNWIVRAPDAEIARFPDFARASVTQTLLWFEEQDIQVAIDSFHDDVSWVVVLASAHPAA